MQKKQDKFELAIGDLESAIRIYEKNKASSKDERIYFMLLVKAFEILVEYSWKKLKVIVEDEGLEALTPKDIFKVAASVNLIDQPKFWLDAINTRNLSVHDYYSIPNDNYYHLAKEAIKQAKKILKIKK